MSWVQKKLNLFSTEPDLKTGADGSSTFIGNMKRPVHRWFRFSAGFSAEWVKQVIREYNIKDGETVFDPFAGSGTTLIAAKKLGRSYVGIEIVPQYIEIIKQRLSEIAEDSNHATEAPYTLKLWPEGMS